MKVYVFKNNYSVKQMAVIERSEPEAKALASKIWRRENVKLVHTVEIGEYLKNEKLYQGVISK